MLTHAQIRGFALLVGQILLVMAISHFARGEALAQNVLDDTTPPGQAPGAPSGS